MESVKKTKARCSPTGRFQRKGRKWDDLRGGLGKSVAQADQELVEQAAAELDSARKRLADAAKEAKAAELRREEALLSVMAGHATRASALAA